MSGLPSLSSPFASLLADPLCSLLPMTRPPRLASLNAMRGLAALCVAAFHFPAVFWGSQTPALRNAYVLTNLFFALSGFLLMSAYGDRLDSAQGLRQFALRRIQRLVPLHLLATAMVLCAPYLAHASDLVLNFVLAGAYAGDVAAIDVDIKDLATQVFLAQGVGLRPELVLNFPAWSLGVIFFCSLLLGLTCWVAPGWRHLAALGLAVAGFMVVAVLAPHRMGSTHDFGFARGMACFFAGAAACGALKQWPTLARAGAWRVTVQAAALVALAAFASAAPSGAPVALLSPFLAVAVLLAFCDDNTDFGRFFSARIFGWLADRSFAIFMLQAPWLFIGHQSMEWSAYFGLSAFGTKTVGLFALASYLAVVLACADLAHRKVELPLRRRWAVRKEPAANATPALHAPS